MQCYYSELRLMGTLSREATVIFHFSILLSGGLPLTLKHPGQNCIQFWPECIPIALKKAKIVYNFGLSECNRVKGKNLLYSCL